MAEALRSGVWWLHRTRGSNVFAVEAADGRLALVDTGFGSSAGAILDEWRLLADGRPLSAILLTHGHTDHAGAAAALRMASGAVVVAGRDDCDEADGGGLRLRPQLGRSHFLRRARRSAPAPPVAVDCPVLGEREVLPGIFAIPAPGHTPGSLCFLVPHLDAAFVGDLVIVHGQELTRPLRAANADDARYLVSLASFAARAPASGYPGHGRPVLDRFGDELRSLAALPRRRAGPLQRLNRARRLLSFSYRLGRRR